MTTIYGFGSVLASLPAFILIPVYTSYLSPKDYGALALLALTVRLLTRVASSPINQGLNRFYYKPDYANKQGELISTLLGILIFKVFILALIYWFFSHWLCVLLLGESSWVPVVRLYGLTIILVPIEDYIITFLRLRKLAAYYVNLNLIKAIIYSVISAVLLVKYNLGIMALVWAGLAGSITSIIVAWPKLRPHLVLKFGAKIIAPPLKYGYPLIITGYAGLLMQSGDRYILKWLGNLSDVGLYSFGYQFSAILNNTYVMPVQNATAPKTFQLERNPEKQRQYLRSSATLYYAFGLLLVLIMSLFTEELIKILAQNTAFWASWIIVPIITLSYLHEGLGNFFVWGLRMKNQSYNISKIAIICVLVNLSLNVLLIPFWGIMGAATATFIAYIVSNALQLYNSSKSYSLYFDIKRMLFLFFLAFAIFGIAFSLASTTSLILNLSIKLGFLLLYPYLLYLRPDLIFQTKDQYQMFCQIFLNYRITESLGRLLLNRKITI